MYLGTFFLHLQIEEKLSRPEKQLFILELFYFSPYKIIPKLLGNIFISVWVYLMYWILNLNQSSMTIISFYLCMTCYNWTWKLEWKQVILMATLLGRFAGFAHSGRELGELKLRPFLYRKILNIQFTSPIHRYFFLVRKISN